MVDFSYKRPVMDALIFDCKTMLILDHHKSAKEDLSGIFDNPKVNGEFDMERCGAMMAWNWYFPTNTAPELLRHIQDRDLWKLELDGTKEISQALRSYPQTFELWDYFMTPRGLDVLRKDGKAINRYHWQKVQEAIPHAVNVEIGGYIVPVCNAPYFMASDLAGELAKNADFAAVYWVNKGGEVTYSLRSRGDFDVSEIAIMYGGGGHKNAAGFKVQNIIGR